MAGNQVLEWFDIDSEVKTANLKDVSASRPLCVRARYSMFAFAGSSGAPRPARQRRLPVSSGGPFCLNALMLTETKRHQPQLAYRLANI